MKIDANKVYAALAFDGENAVPLRVDPTTGRVLAKIYAEDIVVDGADSTGITKAGFLYFSSTSLASVRIYDASNWNLATSRRISFQVIYPY